MYNRPNLEVYMANDYSAKVYPLKKEKRGAGNPPKPREVVLVNGDPSTGKRNVAVLFNSKYILSDEDYRVNKDGIYVYRPEHTKIVMNKLYDQYLKWLSSDRNPIIIHSNFLNGTMIDDFIKSGKLYGYNINLLTTTSTRD